MYPFCTGCGVLICLVGVACLFPSPWILSNLSQNLGCGP